MKKMLLEAAENLVIKFRSVNRISLTEPINMKTVLRKNNILTIYRPLSENYYGLSLKSKDDDRFMLINSNTTRGRQHFTIAHELYHLYFDENPSPHIATEMNTSDSVTEKNADMFASALLMPKEGVLQYISTQNIINKDVNISAVLRLEQYFSVSRLAMLLRLRKIGLLTENTLQSLKAIPVIDSAKQYGYDISLYNKGNENLVIGDFGEKARKLFDAEKISEGHYIELLNMIYNESEN
ncbi:MAG: ImmA/IrrE family metallo-endopeptidase [Prolixibacteraceae bacterium]|nr:ImmA/IrrE family metallo-endopeptidase [Prolixibacteraceae bacterium]